MPWMVDWSLEGLVLLHFTSLDFTSLRTYALMWKKLGIFLFIPWTQRKLAGQKGCKPISGVTVSNTQAMELVLLTHKRMIKLRLSRLTICLLAETGQLIPFFTSGCPCLLS
jgi:hypothetical protein